MMIAAAMLSATLVAGVAYLAFGPGREPHDFGVSAGMTLKEVEARVGRPPDWTSLIGVRLRAEWHNEQFGVMIGENGQVDFVVLMPPPPTFFGRVERVLMPPPPTFFERAREWLRANLGVAWNGNCRELRGEAT